MWMTIRKSMSKPNLLKLIFFLSGLFGFLLNSLLSSHAEWIEKYYSMGFYKIICQVISFISGFFPFSLAEALLVLAICFLLWKFFMIVVKMFKSTPKKPSIFFSSLFTLFSAASFVYFLFILLWGLNYNRLPFSQIASMDVKPSSLQELSSTCRMLIDRANMLRAEVSEDSLGVMTIPHGPSDIFTKAQKGYEAASTKYSFLSGSYNRPKGVIFSKAMSYAGITGIFCPFTSEANVDTHMPYLMIPSTACHEMAHQRGFAREDEANYIAYLTCSLHPDTDFQYSGTILAVIYCMNALYKSDKTEYQKLSGLYGPGLRRDLKDHSLYWQQFEGPIDKTANKINNAYLKANGLKDGVKSYGRMVDLILAEQRMTK